MRGEVIIFLTCIYLSTATIPSYIKVCKRSDANLAACIIDSIETLKPKLAEGIPELKVPSIEPLLLETVRLRSGSESAKINANITNLKVWGASAFDIVELKPNLAKNKFIFRLNIPHVYFEGDYDMDMNVLILKYKGQGPITGNFTDLVVDVVMKGKLIKTNDENHLRFDKFIIRMHIGKTKLLLGNLFAQDPAIGAATNEVVNDNSDTFVKEIQPALESSLAEKFTHVANTITSSFTYEELFPES